MSRSSRACVAAAALAAVTACAPPNDAVPYPVAEPPAGEQAEPEPEREPQPTGAGIARYFDREVDLEPFLVGFPYGRFQPDLETGRLFYFDKGDRYTLRALDVREPPTAPLDLASGSVISDVDWSTRSLWELHHHERSNTLWLHADASNDEKMNLWTLDLATQALTQVTTHDYVYGFGFSEDESTIAYLPRTGTQAPFRACLRLRDVASGSEREIVCDSPALTFTWSSPRFSPDGSEVYFNAQVDGDRTRVQLVRVGVNARAPKVEVLTDRKRARNSADVLDGWIDGDRMLFVANDDGFGNLYALSRKRGTIEQLTRYREDMSAASLAGDEVVAVHGTPAGSTLVRVDARTGKEITAQAMPGTVSVLDAHGRRAWVSQTSPDIVTEIREVDLTQPGLAARPVVALDDDLERRIVACEAEPVRIPTFDADPATGRTRELHAFLLRPRRPPSDDARRLAMITAFYGGDNRYSVLDQIMCAAGLTVLSPAVRGSDGFGKAFFSLNDKDLGGDEIVDLFHAARWLEQRTGLPPARIGVYGGSHGGYATMRALTFPPGTNGHEDVYPFGFGMSHAGFSDIESFHDASNIPDWVVLESGDPKVAADLARMKDRSPLTHVARLRAPLLVTHGSQDWRVPVQESRQFVQAAKALQLPVQYVEFEGQGHHVEGLSLQVQLYQARFDFLRAVAEAAMQVAAPGSSAP